MEQRPALCSRPVPADRQLTSVHTTHTVLKLTQTVTNIHRLPFCGCGSLDFPTSNYFSSQTFTHKEAQSAFSSSSMKSIDCNMEPTPHPRQQPISSLYGTIMDPETGFCYRFLGLHNPDGTFPKSGGFLSNIHLGKSHGKHLDMGSLLRKTWKVTKQTMSITFKVDQLDLAGSFPDITVPCLKE